MNFKSSGLIGCFPRTLWSSRSKLIEFFGFSKVSSSQRITSELCIPLNRISFFLCPHSSAICAKQEGSRFQAHTQTNCELESCMPLFFFEICILIITRSPANIFRSLEESLFKEKVCLRLRLVSYELRNRAAYVREAPVRIHKGVFLGGFFIAENSPQCVGNTFRKFSKIWIF